METEQSKANETRQLKEAEEQEKLLASLSTGDRELVEALLRDIEDRSFYFTRRADCNPPNARASISKSPTKFAHPSPRGLGRIVVEQKSFVISGDSAQPFDQLPIAGLADG